MNTFLKWFYRIWFGLVLSMLMLSAIGVYLSTASLTDTLVWIQNTYSPFNILNYLVIAVIASPGIGAYLWREKRLEKQKYDD